MAPPIHNEEGDESIRDLLRELTFEVRGIRKDLHDQNEAVSTVLRWKNGGDEPNRGVDVRMDRLEQSAKIQSRVTWGTVSTLGVLIASKAWDVLIGKTQ